MAKGRQRSQKWYLRNEREVMAELGLQATEGSGAGWLQKEDGENDYILAQLKSTDKQSYSIKQLDLDKLEYHAQVSNKTPVFIVQFLNNDSRYALMAIEDIPIVAEYIKTGHVNKPSEGPIIGPDDVPAPKPNKPKVKSNAKAREAFNRQREQEREARKWKSK
jgi:hypothetical protein